MRNLKLLEKYQPPPPPPRHQRKRKRKHITPRKSFNHPKIASTIMKKTQTPHLKILNFSKNPNSIGNFFDSFEVTRPINPSRKIATPPEKMSTLAKKCQPLPKKCQPGLPNNSRPKKFPTPPEKISTRPHKNC